MLQGRWVVDCRRLDLRHQRSSSDEHCRVKETAGGPTCKECAVVPRALAKRLSNAKLANISNV